MPFLELTTVAGEESHLIAVGNNWRRRLLITVASGATTCIHLENPINSAKCILYANKAPQMLEPTSSTNPETRRSLRGTSLQNWKT